MGYYGITFSATNLSDDFYLNYELAMQVAVSLAFNLKNVVTLTNYQLFVIAALITFLLLSGLYYVYNPFLRNNKNLCCLGWLRFLLTLEVSLS